MVAVHFCEKLEIKIGFNSQLKHSKLSSKIPFKVIFTIKYNQQHANNNQQLIITKIDHNIIQQNKNKRMALVFYAIFVSFNHVGDYNQGLEIKKLLSQKYSNFINAVLIDVEDELFIQRVQEIQTNYIHSIGEKGMNKLAHLKNQKILKLQEKCIIVQIHQHFDQLNQIEPSFLIIPQISYQDTPKLAKSTKIFLFGTLFQKLSNDKLQEIFSASVLSKEINQENAYIIVMLSGDAPDQQQKMRVFSKQSADDLLLRLVYFLGNLNEKGIKPTIIIQNGPRTGKHDPQTGKQVCLHKFNNGEDPDNAIDSISSYFVSRLNSLNIHHIFYNFSFEILGEKRIVNSFYKPLLYIARQKGNFFFFPMQSVSMCSELPYYIEPQRLIAYHTSSTNQSHLKFVQEGFNKGLYNKITENSLRVIAPQKQLKERYDQAEKIIQTIVEKIKADQKQRTQQI